MIFKDICEAANKRTGLTRSARLADKAAYWAMLCLTECFKQNIFDAEEAKKEKAVVEKQYYELSYNESRVADIYTKQQEAIRSAESDISKLMKSAKPDSDFKELFLDAMDIVSKLEGHQTSVYRKQLESKLKPKE